MYFPLYYIRINDRNHLNYLCIYYLQINIHVFIPCCKNFIGIGLFLLWAVDGTRTRNLHLGKVTFYQLSYYRMGWTGTTLKFTNCSIWFQNGADDESRTHVSTLAMSCNNRYTTPALLMASHHFEPLLFATSMCFLDIISSHQSMGLSKLRRRGGWTRTNIIFFSWKACIPK